MQAIVQRTHSRANADIKTQILFPRQYIILHAAALKGVVGGNVGGEAVGGTKKESKRQK